MKFDDSFTIKQSRKTQLKIKLNIIEQRQIIICICIFIGIVSLIIKFQSNEIDENERILSVCQMIKKEISSKSDVLYKNDVGYNESISHYALTSTEQSVCSVLPFETNDVSIIVSLIFDFIEKYVNICV